MELIFTCPECGCNLLEEVMKDVTVTTVISAILNNYDFEYDQKRSSKEDGEIARYQCISCGFTPRDEHDSSITCPEALVDWLKEQKAGPRVIVVVDEGLVQRVYSDQNIDASVLDYDVAKNGSADVVEQALKRNKRLNDEIESGKLKVIL